MIISRKNFEKKVQEKFEEEMRKRDFERYVYDRMDDLSKSIYRLEERLHRLEHPVDETEELKTFEPVRG